MVNEKRRGKKNQQFKDCKINLLLVTGAFLQNLLFKTKQTATNAMNGNKYIKKNER